MDAMTRLRQATFTRVMARPWASAREAEIASAVPADLDLLPRQGGVTGKN